MASSAGDARQTSASQENSPFNFPKPYLRYSKDKSEASLYWEGRGVNVQANEQHMINAVGKGYRTRLIEQSKVPEAAAKNQLQELLTALSQAGSWLQMYELIAKAFGAEKPLPHKFNMPAVELHARDKALARVSWAQQGRVVADHAADLANYNIRNLETSLRSAYADTEAMSQKCAKLVEQLRQGTCWLKMYEGTREL